MLQEIDSGRQVDLSFLQAAMASVKDTADPDLAGILSYVVGTLWIRGVSEDEINKLLNEKIFSSEVERMRVKSVIQEALRKANLSFDLAS